MCHPERSRRALQLERELLPKPRDAQPDKTINKFNLCRATKHFTSSVRIEGIVVTALVALSQKLYIKRKPAQINEQAFT